MLAPADFFDLSDPIVAALFTGCTHAWDVLADLEAHVLRLTGGRQAIEGTVMASAVIGDRPVYVAPGARIEPGVYIEGPAYIGPNAVVRHGAFLRPNVILLAGSIVGHASEVKHSLLLPGAHAPHFNYVGDSVLGRRVNLGAGTKLSNLAMTSVKDPKTGRRPTIQLAVDGEIIDTGLAKLGAILGDDTQTGCNAVLNPGTVVGPRSLIYANLSLRRGYYPPDTILKLRQETIQARRLDR